MAKAVTDGPSVVSWRGDHTHSVPIMDYYLLKKLPEPTPTTINID